MSYFVRISDQAEKDLRSIFEYIAFELQSVQNAVGQLDRLETAIASLSEMPERWIRYDKEPWFSRGLRRMVVDNYLVFYIPDKDDRTVTIIRVMYGRMDVDRVLSNQT